MMFADKCLARRIETLAVFGDSITAGAGASSLNKSWAQRLADRVGARLRNHGLNGTVLQSTPIHDRRGENGVSRFRRDLLGGGPCDAIAILYGYNDARYTADPERFNVAAFIRDYRIILDGLCTAVSLDSIVVGSPPYPSDAGLFHGAPGFTGQTRAGFEAYRDAVRELAAAYGIFYASVYEAMAARGDDTLSSPDITHPNDDGHAVIAAAFAAASR